MENLLGRPLKEPAVEGQLPLSQRVGALPTVD